MSVSCPREMQEFQFKLLCRLRVFDEDVNFSSFPNPLSIVATSSKYGLIFVSHPKGICVIQSHKIIELFAKEKVKPADADKYPRRIISLPSQCTHVDVSCDNEYLAVCCQENGATTIQIYNIPSFLKENVEVVRVIRSGEVSSLSWNPGINTMLAVCLLDGSALVYDIKNNGLSINSIPAESQSTCLCWSPKGKQIVIGSKNGTLSQFKPELSIVKIIQPPGPLSVVSVQWLSNIQYAVVYVDNSDIIRPVPALYIIYTPKGADVLYTNYDDICYSSSNHRSPQFYLIHQQNWNVLLVASGTSIELGVLGFQNNLWEQWIQEDQSRAELPLKGGQRETFPLGMALDTSAQYSLPIGENQTLPPMPLLYLMSNEGLLSIFFVVNVLPSAAVICNPPQSVPDQSGLHYFEIFTKAPAQIEKHKEVVTPAKEIIKPVATTAPSLWTSQPHEKETNVLAMGQALASQVMSIKGLPDATSTPLQSNTAPVSLFGGTPKTSQAFSLPGTQVSITPVATLGGSTTQQSSQNAAIMYSLGNITQSSTVSSMQATSTPSSPQVTSLPKSTGIIPEPVDSNLSSILTRKPNTAEIKEDSKEISKVNEALIIAAINEEVAIFNSELEELKQLNKNSRGIHKKIGLDHEKQSMVDEINSLETFFKELKDTTSVQQTEVHVLKNAFLDSVSWMEDAKSRKEQSRNPLFIKLMESQGLDPMFVKKMDNIENLLIYLENQIEQANSLLDGSWVDFKSRSPKETMRVPSLEVIYQTLTTLNSVVHNKLLLVEDIEQKLEKLNRKKSSRTSFTCPQLYESEKSDLSKLAENFLKVHLNDESTISCEEQKEEYSNDSAIEEKLNALQAAFSIHEPNRVKPSSRCKMVITDSMSFLSLISSTPANIRSTSTASSNVEKSAIQTPLLKQKPDSDKSESVEIESNFISSSKLETPFKQETTFSPKSIEVKVQDKVPSPAVSTEVKNNVVSSSIETPVKSTSTFDQKMLQTNLFGNKEYNKPPPSESPEKSKSSLASLTTMVSNFTETLPKISSEISTAPISNSQSSQFDFGKTVQSGLTSKTITSISTTDSFLVTASESKPFSTNSPGKTIFGGNTVGSNVATTNTSGTTTTFSFETAVKTPDNDIPTSANIGSLSIESEPTSKVSGSETNNIGIELSVPVTSIESSKSVTSNSSPIKISDSKNSSMTVPTSSPELSIIQVVTPTKQDNVEDSAANLFQNFTITSLSTSEGNEPRPVDSLFGIVNSEVTIETSDKSKPPEKPKISVFDVKSPTIVESSTFGDQSKLVTSVSTSSSTPSMSSLSFGSPETSAATSTAVTSAPFSFSIPQSLAAVTASSFSFAQAASTISSQTAGDKNSKINLTFGQPTVTTSSSIFGGFSFPVTTVSSSTFSSKPASTVSQTSFTFALPQKTTAQTNFFGNKSSVFGSVTTPATTTSSFFGQSTPTTTSSVFGQSSATTPVFGQAASPFASNSGFGAKPSFGQSGGSLFGQSPSGGFGSGGGTSMFGGGSSVFGSQSGGSLFQTTGTGSIFGGGSSTPGGSFSSGGQSVSQSGFGSPPAFQNKLGSFGAAPSFGASPSSAFGSPPSFGSNAAFSSPSKVFGSPTAGGFGTAPQQPTGFESLASQNTMSFGNIAQNQSGGFGSAPVFGGTQQQSGFSSPSTSSNFSGTSFNSWR